MDFDPSGQHPPGPAPSGQNSECVRPVLIHRAIICDSFKVLAKKKPKRSWVTIIKNDLKAYLLTSSDPHTCPWGTTFAPLYSIIHYLRFDMQHDYVCTKWILDPSRPHPLAKPPGVTSNYECVPPVLIHMAITCDSFKVLAKKAEEALGDNQEKGPKSILFNI